jgi:hypothetical protein
MAYRNPESVDYAAMLVETTARFRDNLKKECGITLSVADARSALDAFEDWMKSRPQSVELTDIQEQLLRLFIKGFIELRG